MVQLDQAKQDIKALKETVDEINGALHIDDLTKEHKELNLSMSEPGFWDDVERAQKVNQRVKAIENKLKRFETLSSRLDDVMVLIEMAEEEEDMSLVEEIESEMASLKKDSDAMRLETLLTGQYDANNAILALNAGAGGTEAQDWNGMLYRMYTRFCERRGFEVKTLDYLSGGEAGVKSVTFMVSGENAYGYLKAEKGVHRLVRISPFDSSARRHTSFASLDVMPEVDHDADVEVKPEDIRVDTYRASGAGGQHVNKTDSAIRITHHPTGIVVSCQNERSQIQNRETAMKMLISKLVELKERENMEKMADIKGEIKKIEWGSQIRSYVFHPYKMVKDHRTSVESGNVDAVMDGDLDDFINGYLKMV